MKLRPLSIRFCSTGSPMSPLCRKLRCPCAAVLPRTRGNGCRVKFQATTGRFPCVSRRCLSPLFFSFSFSFSLFLAPSFVIDTRAKRISIRPLDDAIYLQLVPRPPTDAPRSNKESRNPLSSLSPPSLLPPFPLSIVRFGNRANEFFPLHLRSFFVRANFTSHSCEVVYPSTELQLSFAVGKKIFEKDSGLIRERKEERNSYLGYRVA